MDNVNKNTISGLLWKFSERIGAQLVTFVVSILLARLLSPTEYGTIGLVMAFIAIADVFVSRGFGNALIQKKDADNTDFSTVFYCNLILSILLYAIVYFAAPLVSGFYGQEILCPVLRVLGLKIILAAINSIQGAYVSRNMLFKRFFWATLGGTITSAVVGIALAYNGAGIWALVAQYLVQSFISTLILWITVKWRPTLEFSLSRLKPMFKFGWKLLSSSLIGELINQLRSLIIGKYYNSSSLAYYNKGISFPNLILTNVSSSITAVMYPVMAQMQEDKQQLKRYITTSVSYSTFLIAPAMIGMFAVAETMIELLLTSKWLPCVPYLQIACVYLLFQPITIITLDAIIAVGRSDLDLKFTLIKRSVAVILIFAAIPYGVLAMTATDILVTIVALLLNSSRNKELFDMSSREFIKSFIPHVVRATLMAGSVILVNRYLLVHIALPMLLELIIQILVGIVAYLLLCLITRCPELNVILSKFVNIRKADT